MSSKMKPAKRISIIIITALVVVPFLIIMDNYLEGKEIILFMVLMFIVALALDAYVNKPKSK